MNIDVDKVFGDHEFEAAELIKYKVTAKSFLNLAQWLADELPPGAMKDRAIIDLKSAAMFSSASIASKQ